MGLPGHRGHSGECRQRLYDAMQQSDEGRAILAGNRDRMQRRAADVCQDQASAAVNAGPQDDPLGSSTEVNGAEVVNEPNTPRVSNSDEVAMDIESADEIPDLEDSDEDMDDTLKDAAERSQAEALFGGSDDDDDDSQPDAKKQRLRALGGIMRITVQDENGFDMTHTTSDTEVCKDFQQAKTLSCRMECDNDCSGRRGECDGGARAESSVKRVSSSCPLPPRRSDADADHDPKPGAVPGDWLCP